jgi:hypothetical protein
MKGTFKMNIFMTLSHETIPQSTENKENSFYETNLDYKSLQSFFNNIFFSDYVTAVLVYSRRGSRGVSGGNHGARPAGNQAQA